MGTQYQLAFKTHEQRKLQDWSQSQSLNGVMEPVRTRMKLWDGPYRQKERDPHEEWSTSRPFNEAAEQFKNSISKGEIGDYFAMQPKGPKDAFLLVRKIHIVDVNFPTVSSNATPNVKQFYKPVWTEFPQLRYLGCYNCRHIAGSSSWSEHSWADAIDLGPPNMAYGDQVYRWCMANQGRFDITRVLWRVASHYDHLHVDFDPDHSGAPPCA